MIPALCVGLSADTLTGRNTPLSMRVLSSDSIAGCAVAGSSRSARFAVMWNTLYRLSLSGGRRSLFGRDDAGGGCGEARGNAAGSSVGSSSLLRPEAMGGSGCWTSSVGSTVLGVSGAVSWVMVSCTRSPALTS